MGEIRSLTVTLETVTPLFLGGADPRGAPELRAPSFRGALRYWLRAQLGGILGGDIRAVREAESRVFGSTQGASPVIVRVICRGSLKKSPYRPLLHSPSKEFTSNGIEPGQEWTLELKSRSGYESELDIAAASLSLFLLFGGVGKRSRRGFGTLRVKSVEGDVQLWSALHPTYDGAEHFADSVAEAIRQARQVAADFAGYTADEQQIGVPSFPVLSEDSSKVLFCQRSFAGWEEAMRAFWGKLRSNAFRNNPVFGFARGSRRQGSPLHLRVVCIGEQYHLVMTAFRVRYRDNQPQWSVMQNFLGECKDEWHGKFIYGGETSW